MPHMSMISIVYIYNINSTILANILHNNTYIDTFFHNFSTIPYTSTCCKKGLSLTKAAETSAFVNDKPFSYPTI